MISNVSNNTKTDWIDENSEIELKHYAFDQSIFQNKITVEKKYFKIGKRVFRNPFCKMLNHTNNGKISTIIVLLLTGPLGGHRLYLGTKPIVPIVYAITLGGGIGLLPFLDLIAIISTKDLNRYVDNENIIMWIK